MAQMQLMQAQTEKTKAGKLFKGERVVQDGETILVFRDDGGRATSGYRRLPSGESRKFILDVLGRDETTS